MNLNMPFEDNNPKKEITMEEFEKLPETIENPIDELQKFIDGVNDDLKEKVEDFTKIQKEEVKHLRAQNSSQEDVIGDLNHQIEGYRQRLMKLEELSKKTSFGYKLKQFEADFKYFARV